ncbi:MAG TPA: hypothetical protein VMT04_08330 [Terriglobales bacterium]|nr:hypothetical protein [Terriglobales bacterium]
MRQRLISYTEVRTGQLSVIYIVALLFLLIIVSGCKSNSKLTNPGPVKQIWPLAVGNEWTFQETEVDSAGNVLSADTSVWAVSKDTMIGSERWYIITVNDTIDPEMINPLTNRSDGLWGGGPSGGLIFKYPATVNDTFMIGNQVTIVVSIHATVMVPAGTFVCYNYEWPEPPSSDRPYQFHYMSPGIGFVKAEEYHKTPGGYIYLNFRSELISYVLK